MPKEELEISNEKGKDYWKIYAQQCVNSMVDNIPKMYSLSNDLNLINKSVSSGSYSPQTAEQYLQNINITPKEPTQEELRRWLINPSKHQKELRDVSQFLDNTIMQYRRTTSHFGEILTFKSQLIGLDVPKGKEETDTYLSGYKRCNNFLRKFNGKYQFNLVMKKVIEEGGMFAYLQKKEEFATIIEIPSDWCYITGRWDYGFTYAIDLSYYDQLVGLVEVTPELSYYYKKFIKLREAGLRGSHLAPYQYFPVPVEDGYVFTFNPLRAEIVPPFVGVFKDALAILDYKNLQKQKAMMDVWKVIAQEIPKDNEGKPAIDFILAEKIIASNQGALPQGTSTFATPMEVKELNFNNSQSQNNINGLGEQLYWRSIGVNGSLMDLGDKSSASLRLSLLNDVGFVEHMYYQFENFLNIQLFKESKMFRFQVSYYGNRYTDDEDCDNYAKLVISANMPIGKLYGYHYEPYQVDGIIAQEKILKWKEDSIPIIAGAQTSNKETGAPTKSASKLGDAGDSTRDYDSNSNK